MISPEAARRVRAVADAVLYEGYLLYPYRSSSRKNQSRWQFGVLGPVGADARGVGEESSMACAVLMRADGESSLTVLLRFLQLQTRNVERLDGDVFTPVSELSADGTTWTSWDEAVEQEIRLDEDAFADAGRVASVRVDGGAEIELVQDGVGAVVGRVVRTRWPLCGEVRARRDRRGDWTRLSISVENLVTLEGTVPLASAGDERAAGDKSAAEDERAKRWAIRHSLIGAHLVLVAEGTEFASLLDPPAAAAHLVAGCEQHRCYPVLAGVPGENGMVLVSPIILYDYPEVAEQSDGTLFDATEIDEILTLRIMTLTEDEKRQARETDPRAAAIIDRCEQMSPAALAQMHGVLRDPHALDGRAPDPPQAAGLVPELSDDMVWWDQDVDTAVRPDLDGVLIAGVRVAKGSMVRLRPSRRADAQDFFFAGQVARVTTVHGDVDGGIHVGVVLVDDPASEMHEWYGRYLYFAPDEVEPITAAEPIITAEPAATAGHTMTEEGDEV